MSDTVTSGAAEAEEAPKTTISITVDGRPHEAQPNQLVIDACEDAGAYVPRFCYHPRMSPVGMCRQCLVEVEGPRGPMMVVSCMTPVAEGQVVNTETDQVKRAQEGVLELLLANHPLDCPVCDKGGECPLQDQAFSHGPGESRFVEEKRHYEKPIAISDLVLLDRERCILCDRCTRFADEVAGDKLIHFTHRGGLTQVLTFPDEPFSSYFSGNTVQICPVGALTSKPYRFKARPWDLEQVESTCQECAVGCRTVVQSSRDELIRRQGLDSEPVNWGWLCDRGRFNYEAVNSAERLGDPLVRTADGLAPTTWSAAIATAAQLVRDALAAGGPQSVAVLGGARGTNEDAFAWARWAREVVGTPNVDAQLGDGLPYELFGLPRATIAEAASAPTVVLLGPDIKEELPVLYLRVRDAAEKRRSRLLEFSSHDTGLTRYTWKSVRARPGELASVVRQTIGDDAVREQLAKGPVVVIAGRGNLAESADLTVAALAELRAAVPDLKVLPAPRRGNVTGALQLGMRPGYGGLDSEGIIRAAADGKIECLVLVGSDPIDDFPDADLARRALAGARRIIAVDTFLNDSSKLADVVFAAAASGEKSGTTTNLEGRVTVVNRKITARGTSRPDWMIATELALAMDADLGYSTVEEITDAIAATVPAYSGATRAAIARRGDEVVAVAETGPLHPAGVTASEQNSYDYRLVVSRTLWDDAVGTRTSPSLAHLAGDTVLHVHPLDVARIGTRVGASVVVSSPRTSVVLPVVADESVQRGTVWVPFNHRGVNVGELIDASAPIIDVRIENV